MIYDYIEDHLVLLFVAEGAAAIDILPTPLRCRLQVSPAWGLSEKTDEGAQRSLDSAIPHSPQPQLPPGHRFSIGVLQNHGSLRAPLLIRLNLIGIPAKIRNIAKQRRRKA